MNDKEKIKEALKKIEYFKAKTNEEIRKYEIRTFHFTYDELIEWHKAQDAVLNRIKKVLTS